MPVPPIGRRQFLAGGGGLLFCTLDGHQLRSDSKVNLEELGRTIPVPPKVAAAAAQPDLALPPLLGSTGPSGSAPPTGQEREYWIRAEKTHWNIIPTHFDQMMDKRVKGRTTFTALAYRAYSPNVAKPLGPATIPGPLLSAQTGDTVVVNFHNASGVPVTMHPHGIFYTEDMDGAYKGKYTDPGGFVESGRTFQYVWEARAGTEGAWLYHDHGPLDPVPVFKGLFGGLIIRKPTDPVPDRSFLLCFHSFIPVATGINNSFACINGRSYAGNTPTLQAKVGETVEFNVFALDDDFHTFHLHGHRWTDPDGAQVIDTKVLGPGDILTARFVEDNPGRWFYHCHVFSHLHMGMNGWYIVTS